MGMRDVKVGDVFVDSAGFPAWVSEFKPEWSPISRAYSDPKPVVSDWHGSAFYDLSRYTPTGLNVKDVEAKLAEHHPNYSVAINAGVYVNWLKVNWKHLQALMNGSRLSCTADDPSAMSASDILLYATLFEFQIDFSTALAWFIAQDHLWKLDAQQALTLLEDDRFWLNKWTHRKSVYEFILSLAGIDKALAWSIDYVSESLRK